VSELSIESKAVLAKYFVPLVPWLLFAIAVVLPAFLAKRLGGKHYKDNGVLPSFLTMLGLAIGLAAISYWHEFSTPPKPLTAWPTDFADYFDDLRQRMATFWPLLAAWVIPVGVALLKLFGWDSGGQLFEKLASPKK
jgi:hypothetical protein